MLFSTLLLFPFFAALIRNILRAQGATGEDGARDAKRLGRERRGKGILFTDVLRATSFYSILMAFSGADFDAKKYARGRGGCAGG